MNKAIVFGIECSVHSLHMANTSIILSLNSTIRWETSLEFCIPRSHFDLWKIHTFYSLFLKHRQFCLSPLSLPFPPILLQHHLSFLSSNSCSASHYLMVATMMMIIIINVNVRAILLFINSLNFFRYVCVCVCKNSCIKREAITKIHSTLTSHEKSLLILSKEWNENLMAVLILFLQLREIPSHFPAIRLTSSLSLSSDWSINLSKWKTICKRTRTTKWNEILLKILIA